MSARKQILLKRHRRQKRIALLLALIVLALVGVLVAWWWVPVLLLLGWVAHEAWFADHLFYSPGDDYLYEFPEPCERVPVSLDGLVLSAPASLSLSGDETLVLALRLKSGWLGRFIDPCIELPGGDRQVFERGVDGLRFAALLVQGGLEHGGNVPHGNHRQVAPDFVAAARAFHGPHDVVGLERLEDVLEVGDGQIESGRQLSGRDVTNMTLACQKHTDLDGVDGFL